VQKEIEDKSRVIVGVNEFASKNDPPFEVMKVDPALEAEQVERLQAFRAARDSGAATRALDDLRRSAKGSDNLLPMIVSAVKARCTLGEIANSLRDVFGEHGR
jgi:methylmalonyl-CoA mutase N-terminal domain/subunit